MPEVLRPLSFGELLDGAFALYRRNFATFFLTALVPLLPIVVFWLVVPLLMGGASDAAGLAEVLPVLLAPYNLVAAVLLYGGLTAAGATAYGGGSPRVGASLGRGLRRWLPLAVASVIAWFAFVLGFILLIVPGLILIAMFFAIYPVIVIEGRGPIDALSRSAQLSKGARGRILGVTLVAWLITMLPTFAVMFFAGVGIGLTAGADANVVDGIGFNALMQAGSTLASAATWPFLMAVTLLLYYDRRARTEAPDLETALDSLPV